MDTVCPITDRLCEGNVEEAAIELLPLALAERLAEVTRMLREERAARHCDEIERIIGER